MPSNPIALDLLRKCGVPVAAPSANMFGHVSPTRAEHVYDDFHENREAHVYVLRDGEGGRIGLESTVVKVTDEDGKKGVQI